MEDIEPAICESWALDTTLSLRNFFFGDARAKLRLKNQRIIFRDFREIGLRDRVPLLNGWGEVA